MPGLPSQLAAVMVPEPANIAAHWAASCHARPPEVWREWEAGLAVALLPAGRSWDAVAMSYTAMQAVAQDQQDPQLLDHAAILADMKLDLCYLFVPVGAASSWDVPGTTPLGESCWLVASQPGRRRQQSAGTWVQEATLHDPLVDADRLRAALLRTAEVHP
ncbi:hypothetical protein OOK31_38615 [Streptomyces sp. NBC_00249]|uniref:hypothetical protein n=1 Tax=Streptomyces sp. NBC_00249 TaxID=2975690 RepID=UPI002257406E|nr:hypothetical protein [Streptomyces sp. NBC_00249]MCX5199726.1 hypothetical protein [Streptomyces sp. NBC_00249]